MTIIDYVLISIAVVAGIYTVYRLFMGWRNSTFRQDEGRTEPDRLNASQL
ncbi:MAG TPA: hypothetical protein VFA51_05645 [Candidatus Udaeobacter sp.]|nr:hypothetical protein [Candidatus Udaeobacter sp.]